MGKKIGALQELAFTVDLKPTRDDVTCVNFAVDRKVGL
jgi:hypothetical protein